jgi:putative ABC transport system ATP-binding protein
LLGLLAGLDRPTSGQVFLDGQELGALSEDERARIRGEKVGFVFQAFQLIPTLTAQENVQVPMELRGDSGSAPRARELLARVGLAGREHHYPSQLSGGEQQRVALARGFLRTGADLLILDEPSSGLDAEAEHALHQRLVRLRTGRTSLLISHRLSAMREADRVVVLQDGRVSEEGPHGQLLAAGGDYARLFSLQAAGYQAAGHQAAGRPEAEELC